MTSVIKNGQPSMEEILASIRRIVADDTGASASLINLNGRPLERSTGGLADDSRVDESPDFELPSMFRPGQDVRQIRAKAEAVKQNSKSAPIGRLTDAIRGVAPKVKPVAQPTARSEAVRVPQSATAPENQIERRPDVNQSLSALPAETHVGATTHVHPGDYPDEAGTTSPTSSFGPEAHPAPSAPSDGVQVAAAVPEGDAQPQQPADKSAAPVQSAPAPSIAAPPRVMAPFHDTKMNRMSSMRAQPEPAASTSQLMPEQSQGPDSADQPLSGTRPQTEVPAVNTQPAASATIGAIVPGALDLPGRETTTPAPAQTYASTSTSDALKAAGAGASELKTLQPTEQTEAFVDMTSGVEGDANPPPRPDGETGSPLPKIEDATADLLRPMLRQWLSDNMPRMVEKALHIEVAESVKSDKSEDGG